MRLNSPHPPGSSLPAAHTRNLSKHLFNSLQRHERSSRTNTSSSPLLSASPADHRESNCIATVQLQRHTTELSLYIFLFHPNHSSGNKRQPSCQIPSPPMLPRHCESCHLHQALSRVHPRWIHLYHCLPQHLYNLHGTVVCSLMPVTFQWGLFHTHSSSRVSRGWPSFPPTALWWPRSCRGLGEEVHARTRVCRHTCGCTPSPAGYLPNWRVVGDSPRYPKSALTTKPTKRTKGFSKPGTVAPFPGWHRVSPFLKTRDQETNPAHPQGYGGLYPCSVQTAFAYFALYFSKSDS